MIIVTPKRKRNLEICFDCRYTIMSTRRHVASNNSLSSVVQIAFDSNPTSHHCGYCNTDGSCSAGLYLSSLISLRSIQSSHCGYCQIENGKISFGKRKIRFFLK